jgi:hypothetical protein
MRSRPPLLRNVDDSYDAACDAAEEAERALASHLREIKGRIGCNVTYTSLNKESHVYEVGRPPVRLRMALTLPCDPS